MSVVMTSIGRTRDWRALEALNRECLVERARAAGATSYRVYRNARDAAELLLVAEFPDHASVGEAGRALAGQLGALLEGGASDDRVWERTDLAGIG